MLEVKKCTNHDLIYLRCSFKGCIKENICKECIWDSKSDFLHAAEHFDFLSRSSLSKDEEFEKEFQIAIKNDEVFHKFNEIALQKINEFPNRLDNIFGEILRIQQIFRNFIQKEILQSYNEATNNLCDCISSIETHISDVKSQSDTFNKSFLQKSTLLKEKLIKQFELFSNEDQISSFFDKILIKVSDYIFNKDLLYHMNNKEISREILKKETAIWKSTKQKYAFDIKTNEGLKNSISEDIVEGSFTCKVKIHNLDTCEVASYGDYAFGLLPVKEKLACTNQEGASYEGCFLLKCRGLIQQNTSSDATQYFPMWKIKDTLIMKRDEKNNVYFGINEDSELKLLFSDLKGSFHIVLFYGYGQCLDFFEMLELTQS
jgi:hypothetical protein